MLSRPLFLTLTSLALLGPARVHGQTPPEQPPAPRDRALLGLFTEAIADAEFGVRVTHVVPKSAAETIGLKRDDVVLAVNDVLLTDPTALSEEIRGLNIGSTLRFLVQRGDEKTNLQGKIGSFLKTMEAYQASVRSRTVGKPLQAPPRIRWWNSQSKSWREDPTAFEKLRGSVTIIFSFDECKHCMSQKFGRFSLLDQRLSPLGEAAPMKVVGIYFGAGKTAEESYKSMDAVLAKHPVGFPLGVASYPEGEEPRHDEQVLLHRHGVAILDTAGMVSFIQIHGNPGQEFVKAYEAAVDSGTSKNGTSSGSP